jgi:DNA-binding MarR family transcriptional regulator
MTTNNTDQAKSAKEQLLDLLEKKPKIYQDAVKWTLACWDGIRMSSLFEDIDFSKVDRTAFLKELQEGGSYRLENDPKDTSEVIVHLTEQGRDEIVDLFYSGKEKKELKRLFKRFESIKASLKH